MCFVVGRKSRGQGVAAALLDAAVDYARDHGATTLEAYPVDIADGERIPSANAYHGTLGMFERAGFKVVGAPQGQPERLASPDRPQDHPAPRAVAPTARLRHLSPVRHRHPTRLTPPPTASLDCPPACKSRALV